MLRQYKCENCEKFFERKGKRNWKFCSKKCSNIKWGDIRLKISLENEEKSKICIICNTNKPLNNFSYNKRADFKSGRKNTCKRCGANIRELNRTNRTWKDDAKKILLNNSKIRAKHKNLENTLELANIIIPDYCPIFGFPLKREDKKTWKSAPSIDRIDNTKGYTPDNIIIVSRRANILKKDATADELIKLANFYSKF